MEIWKKLEYPFSQYSVSTNGNLRNDKTEYVFVNNTDLGYIRNGLTNEETGKIKHFLRNRLVAMAFLKCPGKYKDFIVHHKDNNPENNNVSNLKWVTSKENNQKENKKPPTKFKPTKSILQYDLNGNFIKEWCSIKEAAGNYSKGGIVKSLKYEFKRFTGSGYYWKYKDVINLPGEIWKTITYKDVNFTVSNMGRLKNDKGHLINGTKNTSGYITVFLNSIKTTMHRLVCLAFHSEPIDQSFVVNHKDLDKSNNKADNLEWISQSENRLHANHIIKFNPRRVKVKRIDYDGAEVIYESIEIAAQENLCSKGNIVSVCKGNRNTTGGYKWKYVKN